MLDTTRSIVLLFIFSLFLLGCQPKVYLMPPPIGILENSNFFRMNSDRLDDNYLYTLYATNRQPLENKNNVVKYTIFPSDTLRLGLVVHSVGEKGMV